MADKASRASLKTGFQEFNPPPTSSLKKGPFRESE